MPSSEKAEPLPELKPIDVPSAIERLGEIHDRRAALEREADSAKKSLLLYFRNTGTKNAESEEWIATRVPEASTKAVAWTKGNLLLVYGEDFIKETEKEMRDNEMFVSRKEHLRIVKIKKKADEDVAPPAPPLGKSDAQQAAENFFSSEDLPY